MKKQEIKLLEVEVAKVMKVDKVKIVTTKELAMKRTSVVELHPQQPVQKKSFLDKLSNLLDVTLDKLDDPAALLMKIKPVEALVDYFFPEEDEEYEIEGHYDHTKNETTKEGNVVYLNRDFKQLK